MIHRKDHDDFDLFEMENHCRHPFPSYKRFSDSDSESMEISPCHWLFKLCQIDHPSINLELGVLGGIPHLDKARLSVGQILGRLYVLGSIDAVVKYYSPDISEEDIKEAIAYAQDFLELASDPSQVND